ncbi:hypothetical protein LCGC14_2001150, partial [marine sediment metagenome]
MEQVIFGGFTDLLHDTTTEYSSLAGGAAWVATGSFSRQVVSTGGVIKNLRVKLVDSPGAGKHYDFTLMLNGNPTALTLEIADAATTGSNTANEIAVTAGDIVYLECNPDSTPTARYATWTSVFVGTTAKESLILGGSRANTLDKTNIRYIQLMGGNIWVRLDENEVRQVCPTAGKIKNLYVLLSADPGTDPDAYRFTLRIDGVNQTLTVTITADNTTGNDTANEVVVAAGDVLTIMVEPLNTPSATPYAYWGMTFVADNDGESVVLSGTPLDLHATQTRYNYLQNSYPGGWSATETIRYQLGQVCTLKKLYVLLSGAPGAGNKYTFTARIAGASSNVVAEVADTATTGNSGALTDTVANDEYVNLMVVPTSTPTVRDAYWGLVSFIAVIADVVVTPTTLALSITTFIPVVDTTPTIIDSYVEANRDNHISIKALHPSAVGLVSALGQSFTGDGNKIGYVQFYIKKTVGSPVGELTARLYAISGTFGTSNVPAGAALASSSPMAIEDIGAGDFELVTFTFDGSF